MAMAMAGVATAATAGATAGATGVIDAQRGVCHRWAVSP
jgi:hypothetical protein